MTVVGSYSSTEARFVELCRQATAVLVAAMVSGMVFGGVGSRVFMLVARLMAPERRGAVTEAGNVVGEVTFAGSFFLIVFAGLLTAIGIGVLIGITQPWLEGSGGWEGPIVGWMVLAVFSRAVIEPDNFDFFLLGDEAVTVAMIAALGIGAGWCAILLRNALLVRAPMRDRIAGGGSAYLPGVVFGVLGLVLVVGLVGASDTPSTTSPLDLTVGASLGALAILTIVDRVRWMIGRPRVAAMRSMALTAIVVVGGSGTLRLARDIADILP